MNVDGCGDPLRDLLPDVAAGRASDADRARVLGHVGSCAACADELRVLKALQAGRPSLPDALAARIGAGVREGLGAGADRGDARAGRPTPRVPWWALAAAAVAAVLMPGLMDRAGAPSDAGEAEVVALAGTYWLSGDPLVAGAPVLETLTDDELERLLQELER